MSLTFDGTTGALEWVKGGGTMPRTALPVSFCVWLKSTYTGTDQWAVAEQSAAGDTALSLWLASNGTSMYAVHQNSGVGSSAANGVSASAMKLACVNFASATSRGFCFGSNSFVSDSGTRTDDVNTHDRVLVGARRISVLRDFWKGDIAELHFFNRALVAADYDAMSTGTLPETVSGWIDGWTLKDTSTGLVSIGGSRTLSLVGGVSNTGSHPITRSSPGPNITAQPSNQTVTTPATATFTVTATASGGGSLSYQWQRSTNAGGTWVNVTTGTGGTTSSYTTAATSVSGGNANSADQWHCVVTETGGTNPGSATSNAATLTVNAAPSGPTINTHPTNQTVVTPATASFSVAATTSGGALSYQWQRSTNGGGAWANVSTGTGGTSASYTTAATSVSGGNANSGDQYRCAVTDSNGTTNSNAAALTVNAAVPTVSWVLKNNTGQLLTSTTVPKVKILRLSDMASILDLTNQTSAVGTAVMTVANVAMTSGVDYLAVCCDATGLNAGVEKVTAA